MQLPWVEKYRPKTRNDLIGNKIAINGLFLFLKNWELNKSKPGALLIGPAGSGKTSAVHAIANDLDFVVTELNASDTRKKKSIINIVGPTANYQSLEDPDRKRVILMDEVDGISGRYDRGGLTEFIKILKQTAYPVVCTANDPESDKLDKLKKILRVFEYERLDEFEVFELLLSIVEKEKIKVDETALEEIASKAAGDVRAAINELESHTFGTALIQLEERNKMITLSELFNELFRSKNFEQARKVMNNAPSDYYKILLFLFDEVADQCKTPSELASSYEQLAQADLVYNRIMRTQDWSLLKYFFSFIGPGLTLARPTNYYKKITKLPNIPSSFKSRGIAKRVKGRALKVAPLVSAHLHTSKRRFVNEEFELFTKIILGPKKLVRRKDEDEYEFNARKNSIYLKGAEIAAWLGLDDSIIEDLQKLNPSSQLSSYIDEARINVGRVFLDEIPQEMEDFSLDPFLATPQNTDVEESEDDENTLGVNDESDVEKMTLDDFF